MPASTADTPISRIMKYAEEIRNVATELRRQGNTTAPALTRIAKDLAQCARVWGEVYKPDWPAPHASPLVPQYSASGEFASSKSEPPIVRQFWRTYDTITAQPGSMPPNPLNHSSDPELIAINFLHFLEVCQGWDMPIMSLDSLQRELPRSAQRPLERKNALVRSRLTGKSLRCWVFRLIT